MKLALTNTNLDLAKLKPFALAAMLAALAVVPSVAPPTVC